MSIIPICLAFEDDLSEAILKEILRQSQRSFQIETFIRGRGFGNLKRKLPDLNRAANHFLWLVLTDLDREKCPTALQNEWLKAPKHPNLLFRIAVVTVESWVLADREAFADFLGISRDVIPYDLDAVSHPKDLLVRLAKKSKKRDLRDALVPKEGGTARVGKDYNGTLIAFVQQSWRVENAQHHSRSLARAIKAIAQVASAKPDHP
jgi:hypothetical protein